MDLTIYMTLIYSRDLVRQKFEQELIILANNSVSIKKMGFTHFHCTNEGRKSIWQIHFHYP